MKKWYTSRTLWIAALQGAAGVIAVAFVENPELASIGWVAIGKTVLDYLVRMNTTKTIE